MTEALEYGMGVTAAIAAATAINIGTAIQKKALADVDPRTALLLPTLLRNRLWLFGFALQSCLGGPFTVAAMGLIGPSATPGLMVSGLIILTVASRRINHEKLEDRSIAGIALVSFSVALIAWSALKVDLSHPPMPEGGSSGDFATLLGSIVALVSLFAAGGIFLVHRRDARGAVLLALGSGSVSALGNLLLGLVSGALRGALAGTIDMTQAPAVLASLAALAVCSTVNMALTQHALRAAKASAVVPLQQVPIQITPIVAFYAVYRPFNPGPVRTGAALLGVLCALAGAVFLASTEAPRRGDL
jgi:drug/metabolite transporter (DMT)-like permease